MARLPNHLGHHPKMGGRYEVVEDWSPQDKPARSKEKRGELKAGDRFQVVRAEFDFLGGGAWESAEVVLEHEGEALKGPAARRIIYAPPRDLRLRVVPVNEEEEARP